MDKNADSAEAENHDSPAERLRRHLRGRDCIPYYEDQPDTEFPRVKYSVYGVPKTNELFVQVSNGTLTFVDVVKSALIWPAMGDRVFGIDVDDDRLAKRLADQMWEKHRSTLVAQRLERGPG
jgi:hypothetical protein